jgi:hypothetical protein
MAKSSNKDDVRRQCGVRAGEDRRANVTVCVQVCGVLAAGAARCDAPPCCPATPRAPQASLHSCARNCQPMEGACVLERALLLQVVTLRSTDDWSSVCRPAGHHHLKPGGVSSVGVRARRISWPHIQSSKRTRIRMLHLGHDHANVQLHQQRGLGSVCLGLEWGWPVVCHTQYPESGRRLLHRRQPRDSIWDLGHHRCVLRCDGRI